MSARLEPPSRPPDRASVLGLFAALCGALGCGASGPRRSEPPAQTAASAAQDQASAGPPASDPSQRDRARKLRAEAILAAYRNSDPVLSPDGRQVLFVSDRGGIPEAYLSDVSDPGRPPRKVNAGPNPLRSPRFTQDGKTILFLRDEGGDENYRIYQVGIGAGAAVLELTPGEKTTREGLFLPRGKPNRMVYSTRGSGSAATRVVVQDLSMGSAPKEVYADAGPGHLLSGNDAGTHVLLIRFVTLGDQILLDVDLRTGKARRVYPTGAAHASIFDAAFASDGARIFVATDEGKEGSVLLALDSRSLAKVAQYRQEDPETATLAGIAVSPRGDRIALAIDSGSARAARLFDAHTLRRVRDIRAEPGVVDLGGFSPDGTKLTFAASFASRPMDVYLADVGSGAAQPLRSDLRPGIADLPPVKAAVEHVTSFDGLAIPMNVYVPLSADSRRKHPAIVEFHGGPEGSSHLFWKMLNRYFTAEGFAFVEPNIRGSSGFGRAYSQADDRERRADSFKDMEAVNHWVRAQPWCDPDRVVILGESYGGYLTLVGLTAQPELWAAGVDLFGPSDLVGFLNRVNPSARKIFGQEIGDVDTDRPLLERLSPSRQLDRIKAPLFVFQGVTDPRVPKRESDELVRALRELHRQVEYMVAENEGHSLERRQNKIEFLVRVAHFLDDHLRISR